MKTRTIINKKSEFYCNSVVYGDDIPVAASADTEEDDNVLDENSFAL